MHKIFYAFFCAKITWALHKIDTFRHVDLGGVSLLEDSPSKQVGTIMRNLFRFVGLKLPKSAGPSGYEYYYADAKKPSFKLETNTLKSDKGAVGRTAQIAIDSKKGQVRPAF